MTVILLRWNIR